MNFKPFGIAIKMKVLLINGSPRRQGNTNVALEEIANQLNRQGIETEVLWLNTKPVRGCCACNKCKEKGNNRCSFGDQDIVNEVIDKMKTSDAIVLGSPVYYGQPAAQLLALQQRMLYAAGSYFVDKPAAVVCVCRRGGATAAFQTLNMPFQMMNMPIVTSQYWNIAYGRTEGETKQDVEGLQTMRTLANNMAWMLKKLHGEPTSEQPEREPLSPMHFIR